MKNLIPILLLAAVVVFSLGCMSAPNKNVTHENVTKAAEPGLIAHDLPNSMYVREVRMITAYITKDVKENISQKFKWEEKPTIENISKVSDQMEVKLTGDDFNITPLSVTTQDLIEGSALWQWNVEPLKMGEKKLSLSADIIVNGNRHHIPTYEKTVEVKVKPGSILDWLQDNWKWVAGAIGAAAGFLITNFYVKRRKQVDGE